MKTERIQFRGVVTIGNDKTDDQMIVRSFGQDSVNLAECEIRVILQRLKEQGLVRVDSITTKTVQQKTGKGEWIHVKDL